MATPLGTNILNSLSTRYVMPTVVDNVYRSNVMVFRLIARNKKILQGGTQIEIPLDYAEVGNGGWFQGFDPIDITPFDTLKNGAYDWKQAAHAVTIDLLTLIKADSPDAVVNLLTFQFEKVQTQLAETLGDGVWSDAVTTPKMIDGLKGAVDDGTVAATYAGLLRSSNIWWKSQIDSSTTTLTLASMQTMFGNCTEGARHPTIIVTTQANYNRYVALSIGGQAFPVQPSGADEQLAANGFTNLLYNGVPLLVDSHVPANHLFYLNEAYMYLYVNNKADFTMEPFREPVNQLAMTSLIHWAGNLCFSNVARSGKQTAVTA